MDLRAVYCPWVTANSTTSATLWESLIVSSYDLTSFLAKSISPNASKSRTMKMLRNKARHPFPRVTECVLVCADEGNVCSDFRGFTMTLHPHRAITADISNPMAHYSAAFVICSMFGAEVGLVSALHRSKEGTDRRTGKVMHRYWP